MLRRGHICYLIIGGLIIVILMKIFLPQNEPKRKVEANHVIDTTINGEGEKEKQLIEDKGINELLEKAKGATTLDIIQGGQNEENQGVVGPPTTITNPQQIQLLVQQLHRREKELMTERDWGESYLLRFYNEGNIIGDLTLNAERFKGN